MARKKTQPGGPKLTVDVVLFSMRANQLAVLLVRRKHPPFEGAWALPGGFLEAGESLEQGALRELEEETGISGVNLEQVGAFGDPGRDPRGHTVSVVFCSFVPSELTPTAGDDAAEAAWFGWSELPFGRRRKAAVTLAFDHGAILLAARRRLQERLSDPARPMRFSIIPSRFTLAELERIFAVVWGRKINRRAFRQRLVAGGLVRPVAGKGRSRTGQLYRWS